MHELIHATETCERPQQKGRTMFYFQKRAEKLQLALQICIHSTYLD